jgi:hypothetical protein
MGRDSNVNRIYLDRARFKPHFFQPLDRQSQFLAAAAAAAA